MSTPVARIVVSGPVALVYVPFSLKAIVKALPARTWDAERKCWLIPVAMVDQLAETLRVAGIAAYVTDASGNVWVNPAAPERPHGHGSTPVKGWADLLLASVGSDRRDRVFDAVATAISPPFDEGDRELMRQLIAARDSLQQGGA